MGDLELTRSRGDRRLYELEGVGSLRLGGWFSRSAKVEADASRWEINRRGIFQTAMEATDSSGTNQGVFKGRAMRRGGELRWSVRRLRRARAGRGCRRCGGRVGQLTATKLHRLDKRQVPAI